MGTDSGYREVRGKMGVFGWLWRVLLLIWQVAMIAWLVSYLSTVAPMVEAGGAEGAGAAVGATLGITALVIIWVAGTVILGLFVLLTRRTKALVPVGTEET